MRNPPKHISRYWPTNSSSLQPAEKAQTETGSPCADPLSSSMVFELVKQIGQLECKLSSCEAAIAALESEAETIRNNADARISVTSKFNRILDAMFWVVVIPTAVLVCIGLLFIVSTLFFDDVTNAIDWCLSIGLVGLVGVPLVKYLWHVKGINSRLEAVEKHVFGDE